MSFGEPKGTYIVILSDKDRPMTAMQSFVFGMMVAWTPSLIVLAWFLWSATKPTATQLWQNGFEK